MSFSIPKSAIEPSSKARMKVKGKLSFVFSTVVGTFIGTAVLIWAFQHRHHFSFYRNRNPFLYTPPRYASFQHKIPEPIHGTLNTTYTKETHVASGREGEVELVVASSGFENTTWIRDRLPQYWQPRVYVTDEREAPLTVPKNKGHEAMVYLTYIIDNYHNLPEFVFFSHANRFQWHNDDPNYDGLAILRRVQLPYIQSEGYVNLRCTWAMGCPAEIRPHEDAEKRLPLRQQATHFKRAMQEILPHDPVPLVVAQSCCAQFAVTSSQIRKRSLAEYRRMRDWILDSDLSDFLTGRIFEYLWHIIFDKEGVYCPDAGTCYCKLYGLCDLTCEDGMCDNGYGIPPPSGLPWGWPYVDFKGNSREWEQPA